MKFSINISKIEYFIARGLIKAYSVEGTSELIRKCAPKSFEDWEDYYFKNVRTKEHIEGLGRKLHIKITEVISAEFDMITIWL